MTSLLKTFILTLICAILVFFGIACMFLVLSLLVAYYDTTMVRLVNATCAVGGSCYFPPASTILGICLVVAVVVGISIFVTVWRHERKGPPRHFMEDLRRELSESKK